jgi:hypothetical protein
MTRHEIASFPPGCVALIVNGMAIHSSCPCRVRTGLQAARIPGYAPAWGKNPSMQFVNLADSDWYKNDSFN